MRIIESITLLRPTNCFRAPSSKLQLAVLERNSRLRGPVVGTDTGENRGEAKGGQQEKRAGRIPSDSHNQERTGLKRIKGLEEQLRRPNMLAIVERLF